MRAGAAAESAHTVGGGSCPSHPSPQRWIRESRAREVGGWFTVGSCARSPLPPAGAPFTTMTAHVEAVNPRSGSVSGCSLEACSAANNRFIGTVHGTLRPDPLEDALKVDRGEGGRRGGRQDCRETKRHAAWLGSGGGGGLTSAGRGGTTGASPLGPVPVRVGHL
eukprot:scaffold2260_cov134-Isochrysis_galbana.AAC.4